MPVAGLDGAGAALAAPAWVGLAVAAAAPTASLAAAEVVGVVEQAGAAVPVAPAATVRRRAGTRLGVLEQQQQGEQQGIGVANHVVLPSLSR